MRILYHISIDDRFKGMFVHTDCIPQVQDPLKTFTCTFTLTVVVLPSQGKLCLCLANANAV